MLAPYAFEGASTWLQRLDRFRTGRRTDERRPMNTTTVTTPNELEIRVERVDALLQRLMSRPEEVVRNG
jgi:hypothetical protein